MKINLEKLEEAVYSTKENMTPLKYDTLVSLLHLFLDYFNENEYDEEGEIIDFTIDEAPISVKLAYNTLLHYGIIK